MIFRLKSLTCLSLTIRRPPGRGQSQAVRTAGTGKSSCRQPAEVIVAHHLSGHVFGLAVQDPSLKAYGVSHDTTDTTLSLGGIGPELDWYIMPANVYLSGTVAVTRLTTKSHGVDRDSDMGPGVQLGGGKEWWVGDHWGLGVAGKATYASNGEGGGGSGSVGSWNFMALFSATYN